VSFEGELKIEVLLQTMLQQGASDLHLSVGAPAQLRVNGRLVRLKMPPLTPEQTQSLCYSVMNTNQIAEFEREFEMDLSFGIRNLSRFRGNIFLQRGSVGGVFRAIPLSLPRLDDLGVPAQLREVIRHPSGLVLVTGATGSGKSTTLAALIDILNETEHGHILTIEDPIEFIHAHKNCVVNQREVGFDSKSFAGALKRVLRQDPDYILIGELRDLESIEMALTMAETGHLVFATLHTNGAIDSISRIVNVFPTHQQQQVRYTLALVLRAVFSQILLPRTDGRGRVLASELMIPNVAIRNMIREDKVHQIYSAMQTGQSESGMHTLNQKLAELFRKQFISAEQALEASLHPDELTKLMGVTIERRGK